MKAFEFLAPERLQKPRSTGLTMMLDKGMGIKLAEDFMEISGEYVDFLKFGWGTIALHQRDLVKNKIEMYNSYGVDPYPGGTLFELAYFNQKVPEFFAEAEQVGFTTVEISDGSTDMSIEEKLKFISEAHDRGFKVISEVGKKDPAQDLKLSPQKRAELVKLEIEAGASYVLIEARESGKNIGMFDEKGNVKQDEVDFLLNNTPSEKLIWEAPQKNQQVYFILKIGANVNLGNIPPEETTALESMRKGLRGDTLGMVNL